jgi:hypothetical protein
MSEEQVAAVVREFPKLQYIDSGRGVPWDKVARKGGTTIDLDFHESRLLRAEVTWMDGILSVDHYPHPLCDVDGAADSD